MLPSFVGVNTFIVICIICRELVISLKNNCVTCTCYHVPIFSPGKFIKDVEYLEHSRYTQSVLSLDLMITLTT